MPNYHLKTTLSTFGGSIFSGIELKANTKMETDVERLRAALHWCIFHSLFLSRSVLSSTKHNEWGRGRKNESTRVLENCAVNINDQSDPAWPTVNYEASNAARWLFQRATHIQIDTIWHIIKANWEVKVHLIQPDCRFREIFNIIGDAL